MIRKSIIKIASILLIVCLNWSGLSAVIETVAYYNDIESSNANTYQAGILDFYLSSPTPNFIPPEIVTSMKPGDSVTRDISVIKETDSNLFQYTASTTKTGGDDDFCNALKLEAKLEGKIKYSGSLMDFNLTPPVVIGGDGRDDWSFTVTLPTGTNFPPGKVCEIKFIFYGWQTNLPVSSGFYDQEEIASSFATGGMKINKVYYDVDDKHGVEYDNEWIEIYNPLDNPVDISGWKICDNYSCDTIPSSNPIPAKGFAIITGSSTTWGYWNIPDDVVKIVLEDGKIGNGLANDGDRVILKMPNGIVDDAMSYGKDTYAFDPPCPDVTEGHILGRVPTGFDTNTASDWKDLGLPKVNVVWPNGGEVLYVGHTYTLRWTATNPNGPDSDLRIDLWYSRDSGNTWAKIATSTENDGAFEWRIPLFIDSYYVPSHHARIKVVAFGPENFMVQAWDMSDSDFCPPIDYSLLTDEEKAQIDQLLAEGILSEADIINREAITTEIIDDGTTTENLTTTTEEIPTTTEKTATTIENQEEPVIIEDQSTIIEEQSAIEEQPVVAPESGSDSGSGGETGTTEVPISE